MEGADATSELHLLNEFKFNLLTLRFADLIKRNMMSAYI